MANSGQPEINPLPPPVSLGVKLARLKGLAEQASVATSEIRQVADAMEALVQDSGPKLSLTYCIPFPGPELPETKLTPEWKQMITSRSVSWYILADQFRKSEFKSGDDRWHLLLGALAADRPALTTIGAEVRYEWVYAQPITTARLDIKLAALPEVPKFIDGYLQAAEAHVAKLTGLRRTIEQVSELRKTLK